MRTHVRLVQISLVITSFLAYSHTFGQSARADSTLTDSTKSTTADTLVKPRIPITLMGSLDRSLPADQVITDSEKHFIDYRYLGDIILSEAGFSVLEFGAPGQWQQLFSEGVDARSIQIMSDGAPLNDGTSGTYNLNYYPTENIECIEFVRGTQAYVYGINSPGGVINILSLSKKAIRPYSHLRYSETAYGEAFIDGMLSQDLLRGLNMTAGAFHATYDGKYLNSNEDHWNGRIKLRYNLSDYVNVSASENYNQTHVGLFGGVLIASPDSAYNQFLATLRNSYAYEKVTRHDLQLNIAQKFPGDSNAVSSLTVYYSNQRREYRDEENEFIENGIFIQQDQASRWYGVRFEHQRNVGNQSITFGGEYRSDRWYENISEHASNLFGIAKLHPVELLQIIPSLRLDNANGNQPTSLSYGSDVALQPSPWFELTGGFSHSKRFPSSEFNGTPTIVTTNLSNPEVHDLFETGIRVHDEPFYSCNIDFFHRNIKDAFSVGPNTFTDLPEPLAFVSHQKRILQGFSAQTSIRYGSFILEGTAQYLDINDPQDSVVTLPRWSANSGLYFFDTLLAHHLHLKIGPQVRAFSSYFGKEFNQQALTYLPGGQEMEIPGSAILNFVVIAKLGDAYIHIVLDNLFDRQYVMNTFYPMVDRSLRFGVSWDFSN